MLASYGPGWKNFLDTITQPGIEMINGTWFHIILFLHAKLYRAQFDSRFIFKSK